MNQASRKNNPVIVEARKTSDFPVRKTQQLRIGRESIQGAKYFVTINTLNRQTGLCDKDLAKLLLQTLRTQQKEGDFDMMAGTIMPNHLHLLFRLKSRLRISAVIGKFKAKTRGILGNHCLSWQTNFFEHRIRADQNTESFARYIYLNPYRKVLIKHTESWPWWFRNRNYIPEFIALLIDGKHPPKEWCIKETNLAELFDFDRGKKDSEFALPPKC